MEKINKNNIIITPLVVYNNVDKDKKKICRENKNKLGIYRLNNLSTGKSYIGSSNNLRRRFYHYYSLGFLKGEVKKGSSLIYNSLLKHGHSNFSLDILEYCDLHLLISREQYYLDLLNPKYNILKVARSNSGYKHSKVNKIKMNIKVKNIHKK